MKKTYLQIILILSVIISGCATVMSGSTQQVTFQSTPDDALVKIDGRPIGKTPLTVQLDKKAGQTLTIEKEGYKAFSTAMDTTMDSWFWGNIIIGGLLGSTTDNVSGAINEYSPGQYIITLEPLAVTQSSLDHQLSKRDQAKKFLFVNYNKLKKELSKNHGEVINATLNVLDIDLKEKETAISQLKKSIFEHKDPAEFVTITLQRYMG